MVARHGYRAIAAPSDRRCTLASTPAQRLGRRRSLLRAFRLFDQPAFALAHGIGTGRFELGRYLAVRALRIVPAYLAVMGLIVASAFPFYVIE